MAESCFAFQIGQQKTCNWARVGPIYVRVPEYFTFNAGFGLDNKRQ